MLKSAGAGFGAGVPNLLIWIRRCRNMPRRSTKKERGVFEKDPGSEIWWIRYYIDGRERREKVGRKKDASDLYKIRKADALRGVKLPPT